MPVGDYVVGLLLWAGIWGAAGFVATVVTQRKLTHLDGVPRVLAWSTVFLCTLLGCHLLPGALTLLSPGTVLVVSVAVALVAWRFVPRDPAAVPVPPPEPRLATGPGGIALAAVAVLVVGAFTLAGFARLADDPPSHIDALTFGLPLVAEWVRSGSIWDPGAFLPFFQVRTYPNNGDLFYLSAILPWSNDAFLRFLSLPLLGITGLSVYATGRELRAPAASAALVAAAVIATRLVSYPAVDQVKPDIFMYATFSTGLFFLVRHARTSERWDLVLAGAGLGLAFGSRWYGLSAGVVVVGVWAAGTYLARRAPGRLLRDGAVLVGTMLATGGFWLVRNAVLTGNPLYPVKLELGGVTLLDAPRDILTEKLGYTIVDRFDQPSVWTDFILPDYRDAFGLPGAVMLAGVLLAFVVAITRRRDGRRSPAWRPLGLAVATAGLAAAYAITPASSQGFASAPLPGLVGGNARWLVPALLAAAPAVAWVVGRLDGRFQLAAQGVLFVAVLSGVQTTWDLPRRDVALAGLAVVALAIAVIATRHALGRLEKGRRRTAIVAGTAAVAVGVAVAGDIAQDRYNDGRYRVGAPVLEWITANAPEDRKVGIAGDWAAGVAITYPAFGPRLGNDVRYVGPLVKEQLRQYHDQEAFGRALRSGGYDLLAVGRVAEVDLESLGDRPLPDSGPLEMPDEAAWAARLGFREVARDADYVLMSR